MIAYLSLVALWLLCITNIKAQSVYTQVDGPSINAQSIISITSHGNSRLWTLNSTGSAHFYDLNTHIRHVVDLTGKSALPIITKLRSAESHSRQTLFAYDETSKLIVMIADNGMWFRTFNLTDFSTFQVSSDGGLLAVSGPFNQFIDVYRTSAQNGEFLYRIQLNGLQSKGFSFNHDGSLLHVIVGLNHSVTAYRADTGAFHDNVAVNIANFDAHAVASDEKGTLAMIDCERSLLHFQPSDAPLLSTTITLPRSNASQCSESIVHVGNGVFAILSDGGVLYFASQLMAASSSSAEPATMDLVPLRRVSLTSSSSNNVPQPTRGGQGLNQTPLIVIMVAIMVGISLLSLGAVIGCCCFMHRATRRPAVLACPSVDLEMGPHIAEPAADYNQLELTVQSAEAAVDQPFDVDDREYSRINRW